MRLNPDNFGNGKEPAEQHLLTQRININVSAGNNQGGLRETRLLRVNAGCPAAGSSGWATSSPVALSAHGFITTVEFPT